MVNQDLMTVFVAITALAVIIQTGILAGFYILSKKLSRQADQAMASTRNIVGPLHTLAENLQTVSARIAETGASTRGQLRQLELGFEKKQRSWHDRLTRLRRPA